MAVSAEVIKQTQSSLGQFVKKPPLTEKLLNKPPFRWEDRWPYLNMSRVNVTIIIIIIIIRFLHDVITAVINDTGTLSGLFDGSEMNSDNVKVR